MKYTITYFNHNYMSVLRQKQGVFFRTIRVRETREKRTENKTIFKFFAWIRVKMSWIFINESN